MTTQLDLLAEFRDDHRTIRDTLFALKRAFEARDAPAARDTLTKLDALTGPHFRFEEESLYPALRPLLADYVDKMLQDHDGAIRTAARLAEIVQQDALSGEDERNGVLGVLSMLPHVSDCEGLSIFMETFDDVTRDAIADSLNDCRAGDVPLITWARTIRARPAL